MSRIAVAILFLVILLLPATPLHADDWGAATNEDCEVLLEAHQAIVEVRLQAQRAVWPIERAISDKEVEVQKAEDYIQECKEALEACLQREDNEIKRIKDKVNELTLELAGDEAEVASLQTQYEQSLLEIVEWAGGGEQNPLGEIVKVGALQFYSDAAPVIGQTLVSRGLGTWVLGPLGILSNAVGLPLAILDRLHFEDLVHRSNVVAEKLREAQTKARETGQALDGWQGSLDKKEAAREEACPNERIRLEEAEEQYGKVQGELERLRQQLEELESRIDDLRRQEEKALEDYWDCVRSQRTTFELQVTASKGGSVLVSVARGTTTTTHQVTAGTTARSWMPDDTSEVTLIALSEGGYYFDGWWGDASGTAATIAFPMDRHRRVGANFEPATVSVPHLTGAPTVTPTIISWTTAVPLTITVPVTTDTNHVAYRMMDSQGNITLMNYVTGQLGKSTVVMQTAPFGPNVGEYWLMLGILGENTNVCSWYSRDPSRSTAYYTVTSDDGAGNITASVTEIPIQWVTVVQD